MSGVIFAIPRFHECNHTARFKRDGAAFRVRQETENPAIKRHLKRRDDNISELVRTKLRKQLANRIVSNGFDGADYPVSCKPTSPIETVQCGVMASGRGASFGVYRVLSKEVLFRNVETAHMRGLQVRHPAD